MDRLSCGSPTFRTLLTKRFLLTVLLLIGGLLTSIHAQAGGTLASGSSTSGYISPGGTDTFTFTANAGEGVHVHFTASFELTVTVYKPGGSYYSASNSERLTLTNLPASGTYTVSVKAVYSTVSGPIQAHYVRAGDTVKNGALSSGTSGFFSLGVNDIESFQFAANAGEGVHINLTAGYEGTFYVYKPDGSYYTASNSERLALTNLPVTGTYSVVFVGAYKSTAGAYAIHYFNANGAIKNSTLSSGGTLSFLMGENDLESFHFTANAGEDVHINLTAGYEGTFYVYKPDGTYYTASNSERLILTSLPVSGTYSVLFMGAYKSTAGAYDIHYVRAGDTVKNGVLNSGGTRSFFMGENEIESFQFTADAGKGVHISLTAGYEATFYVYKPDGTYYTASNSERLALTNLPVTGTYSVFFVGAYKSSSGDYDIHYVHTGGNVKNGTLTSGTTRSFTLDTNDIESFRFSADAGQGAHINLTAGYEATFYVYKPDGSYYTASNSERLTLTNLPETGTYRVLFVGAYKSSSGAYDIHYVHASDAVEDGFLVNNKDYKDALDENGIESFQFTGEVDDEVTLTLDTSLQATMYVYKPDGSYYTASNSEAMTLTLPEAGTYTLVFIGAYKNSTGEYTLHYGFGDNPPENDNEESIASKDSSACDKMFSNPVNIDLGYKKQTETDYSGGLLSFSRIYRSDSTWTDNTLGAFWRHNYTRTLSVSGSSASITDGLGRTVHFTENGGVWSANDPDITVRFEENSGGYVYTTNTDAREIYDSTLKLARIEYRGGGSLDFTYNSADRLESVADEQGRSLTLSYANTLVSSVATPAGTFSYAYDASGNLEYVTRPDAKTRTYHYEDLNFPHALTGITDENNVRYASWSYDDEGRAISSQHAGGADHYIFDYNADGSTTVTNPLGKRTTYYFQKIHGLRRIVLVDGEPSTNCAAASKRTVYDANGWVSSKTDWNGNRTTYLRNSRGLVTSKTEDENGPDARTTTYTYDPVYRLPDVITEDGKTTDYDYDSDGRTIFVTVTDTNTGEARTTTYSYYANTVDGNGNTVLGKLHTVDGPRTDVSDITTYTYDGNLRLTKVTNALGHEVETTSFDAAGRPIFTEDENDIVTHLVYDAPGRLESSTKAYGTPDAATTTYSYDDVGNLTGILMPGGETLTYAYDDARRMTGIEDSLANTTTYTLDDAGNHTAEVYRDNSNTLRYTHTNVYDELSRLLRSIDANTDETVYGYDLNGNETSVTDGNQNPTAYAFDGLNRLVSTTDALQGQTVLSTNALDQTESVTDPRNNATTYTYNAFGEIVQEISPDRGTTAYSYDPAGNMTTRTDARGEVVTYSYDAINRLTSVSYASDSSLNVSLFYDASTGCGYSIGRLCSVTDAGGTTSYVYDRHGHLDNVTETRGTLSFTTSYNYNASGHLSGITLPSGRSITYGLNGNGQVSALSADINNVSTTLADTITYLPFGGLESLIYGNGIALTNGHNTAYQLTSRQIGSLSNESYGYDDAGNITAKGSTSYGYDALYHLTAEDGDSYTYDSIGNRLTRNSETYTYPAASSRMSAVNGMSIATDYTGNITADVSRTYTINAAGHIESDSVGGSLAGSYTYDANNLRTSKTVGGVTTYYVYGMGGKLYGEYDENGDTIREYVYLNGAPLAQIEGGSTESLLYLHTDHLGTPRYATDASAAQVWNWTSDAFGNGAPTGSATVNLRFPGQYYDDESGLHYNWNRYYDPDTGRYISSDPIGLSGGLNTFAYVSANPVMFTDPEGLFMKSCAPGDLVCVASNYGETHGPVEPNTPKHRMRNIHNRCPWKEPTTPICTSDGEALTDKEGNISEPDSFTSLYYHCGIYGYRTYRVRGHGWQCSYMPDGNLDDWNSSCMGTFDFCDPEVDLWCHQEKDVGPHNQDPNYVGGMTERF